MRHLPLLCAGFLATILSFPSGAPAAELTPAQFRKFKGRYSGNVSGIAGNNNLGSSQVSFRTRILVTQKNGEFLVPLISSLHAEPRHRIVWRKPTGNTRRCKRTGVYIGTFTSGLTTGPVAGSRILNFTDRGSGGPNRFSVRIKDTLREEGFSGQDIGGLLKK